MFRRPQLVTAVVLGAIAIVSIFSAWPSTHKPRVVVPQHQAIAKASKPLVDPAAAQRALDAIRREPKVLDVLYAPDLAVEWSVGVADDGSRRTGLAEYFCTVLSAHDAAGPTTSVRIVDQQAILSNGGDFRAASLGHVDCTTGRDLSI